MATFKDQYRKIKHSILVNRNPIAGVGRFFGTENIGTIRKYSPTLVKERFFRESVCGIMFPASVAKLGYCSAMPYLYDLERTLLWYTLMLKLGAKQVNEFLLLRDKFDQAFLWGEYDLCLSYLDECHTQFGWSLWEIKNRIAVLSERDGFDAQKQYKKSVLDQMESGSFIYYLVNCFSAQCERNVPVNTFLSNVQADYQRFIANGLLKDFCRYVRYKAGGYTFSSTDDIDYLSFDTISYFLFVDSRLALIDRYLALISLVNDVFSTQHRELVNIVLPYVVELEHDIADPFFKNIIYLERNSCSCFYNEGSDRVCDVVDLYTKGKYQPCLERAEELLKESVVYFPIIEIYAKSGIYLPNYEFKVKQTSVLGHVVYKLRQLFSRHGDIMAIQMDLKKVVYTHLDSAWARELLVIMKKYNCRLTVLENIREYNFYSAISLPDNIFHFPLERLEDYLAEAPEDFLLSTTAQFAIAVRTKNKDVLEKLPVDIIRKRKYEASLWIDEEPERAVEILESIRKLDESRPIRLEIDALLVNANIRSGNVLRAMEVFISAFSENSNFIYIGSIAQIFKAIKSEQYDLKSSILTPIICSVYFNYYPDRDDRDDIVLSMCYDDYLKACGVQKPSELHMDPLEGVDEINFLRFLAEVCVPNVMDRSMTFTSYDEVLRERIIICEMLIQRDPTFREKYTDEIRRLTNSLLIRLAKREIENGKIYVDVEGIRALLVNEVCEAYERYRDFRNNNYSELSVLILNTAEGTGIPQTFRVIKDLVEDVKQQNMLEGIIKRIRDIFVADNKYGLDGCLSVRIRHGTLESQLRSCFEKHKLITTKAADGSYRKNTHWKVSNRRTSENIPDIDVVFAEFSAEVDRIITRLKKEQIQIKTEDRNPDGLFDFVIEENRVAYIAGKLQDDVYFEKFEEIVLEEMLSCTEDNLDNVRGVLENEINASFQKALKELESKSKFFRIPGLSDQIAMARTDISTELKNIAGWFRLTQPGGFADYPVLLAVDISCEMMQYSHSGYELSCDKADVDQGIILQGCTLSNIVDVFNILLDNVIKHSGFSNKATAKVCVSKDGNRLSILMQNPVKCGNVDEAHLQEVEMHLKDWENKDYINREGGSGFHKIKKILTVDLHCNNYISIGCKDDIFSVEINAELNGVIM